MFCSHLKEGGGGWIPNTRGIVMTPSFISHFCVLFFCWYLFVPSALRPPNPIRFPLRLLKSLRAPVAEMAYKPEEFAAFLAKVIVGPDSPLLIRQMITGAQVPPPLPPSAPALSRATQIPLLPCQPPGGLKELVCWLVEGRRGGLYPALWAQAPRGSAKGRPTPHFVFGASTMTPKGAKGAWYLPFCPTSPHI